MLFASVIVCTKNREVGILEGCLCCLSEQTYEDYETILVDARARARMEEPYFVSIILPTFNRAYLIEQCVNSVLNQTYSNWELVILDDGSTDDSEKVIKKCVKLDPRIRYKINSSNQGLPKNKNIAVSISKGDMIFFIEDDLVLERDCLKILVETYTDLAKENKVGAIAPRLLERYTFNYNKPKMDKKRIYFMLDKKTGEIYYNYTEDFGKIQEVVTVHSDSLYPKKVLEEVGGFEEKAYKGTYGRQETDLNFRIAKRGYKFFFQPKAVSRHEHASFGGCYFPSLSQKGYYFIRNHIVFAIRIFGLKALYMIPLFLINTVFKLIYVVFHSKQKSLY